MAAAKTMRATTSSAATVNGYEVLVQQGQRYASTHPVVRAHAGFFEAEDADVQRPATTRRTSTRRKAK
jgi:hypothetical protein